MHRKPDPPQPAPDAPAEPAQGLQPSQQAVALAYQTGDTAPRVVAKGRGAVAEQIIARAREHGVFVHESKELVALLLQVDLDDRIPPELYRAVAELLAWLYKIEHGKDRARDVSLPVGNIFHSGER